MNYIQKSARGYESLPVDDQLFTDRTVFISGEINDRTASDFTRQILLLNRKNATEPIDVMISSPGGELNSGLLIYDIIQDSPAPIRTICMGKAYSMAAILFACGRHGRYILPNSEIMIHQPLIPSTPGANAESLHSLSLQLMEAWDKVTAILARHSGKELEEIREATRKDLYLTPERAVEFGLADEIIGFHKLFDLKKTNESPFSGTGDR